MDEVTRAGGSGASAAARLAEAAVAGTATAVWYALPDHVASRRARAAVKTALGVAVTSWSLAGDRASPVRRGGARVADGAGTTTPPPAPTGPPDGDRASWVGAVGAVGFLGVVTGAVVGSVALTVAVERAVHRLGERAALRGTSWPHTRNGVVLGSVAALVVLGRRDVRP